MIFKKVEYYCSIKQKPDKTEHLKFSRIYVLLFLNGN